MRLAKNTKIVSQVEKTKISAEKTLNSKNSHKMSFTTGTIEGLTFGARFAQASQETNFVFLIGEFGEFALVSLSNFPLTLKLTFSTRNITKNPTGKDEMYQHLQYDDVQFLQGEELMSREGVVQDFRIIALETSLGHNTAYSIIQPKVFKCFMAVLKNDGTLNIWLFDTNRKEIQTIGKIVQRTRFESLKSLCFLLFLGGEF